MRALQRPIVGFGCKILEMKSCMQIYKTYNMFLPSINEFKTLIIKHSLIYLTSIRVFIFMHINLHWDSSHKIYSRMNEWMDYSRPIWPWCECHPKTRRSDFNCVERKWTTIHCARVCYMVDVTIAAHIQFLRTTPPSRAVYARRCSRLVFTNRSPALRTQDTQNTPHNARARSHTEVFNLSLICERARAEDMCTIFECALIVTLAIHRVVVLNGTITLFVCVVHLAVA